MNLRNVLAPACLCVILAAPGIARADAASGGERSQRPNIVWIVVEDASPHIGCYGETAILTPHIDALAAEGVRFTDAIVTSPVCSPSRSAMVTGMFPTTLGAHNHRSQCIEGKGGGNRDYYDSFRLPIASIPELFRDAGYHVTNRGLNKSAKTDYNFEAPPLYDAADWTERAAGQPFFAQIQLAGGKARGATVPRPVDPASVTLPPYYPDDPVIRRDWAAYLDTWTKTDGEVGAIVQRLRDQGVLDDTVIFFWTDHGVSHLRGKQFLYDEGIRVPLIVRFGDRRLAGSVRDDLVQQIDVAAASLALAGITIPDYLQGQDIFAADYQPRSYAFAARDRCDETVDVIRAVRSKRFKYIRNFLTPYPHAQPNQYKDGKAIVQRIRRLHAAGELDALQASMFAIERPAEELYDLQSDPFETVNLAGDPAYQAPLIELRGVLRDWMVQSRDLGLIPEPILEDLGRKYGNKYHILQQPEHAQLVGQIVDLFAAAERREIPVLRRALTAGDPSLRYWAASWLGTLGDAASEPLLKQRLDDATPAVGLAAALALCQLGHDEAYLSRLAERIEAENLIEGMYAMRAIEQLGPAAHAVLPSIERATDSPYEFTRRIARRLMTDLRR